MAFDYKYRRHVDPYWMLERHESTQVVGKDPLKVDDEKYIEKMEQILTGPPFIGVPPEPTGFADNCFLGTSSQAENPALLKRMRITHVLNVDGFPLGLKQKRYQFYRDLGIVYEEYSIEDDDRFDIYPYFGTCHQFLEKGKLRGNVLISDSSVSRGGAIALSFMIKGGTRLLTATNILKQQRRVAICNRGFMTSIVQFARTRGMLDPDLKVVAGPKTYGRKLDRYRINSAHLPMYVNSIYD